MKLALVFLALVVAGCASHPLPAPEGWETAPTRITQRIFARGPLRAGAARVSVDPPFAVPMGGYFGGSEFRLRGQRDPLFVRAAVFEVGSLRIAVVAVDLVLIPPDLRAAVEARSRFHEARLNAWTLCATHDHTAMGAFARPWAAQRFGIGSFDPLVHRSLAERCAEAIAQAAERIEPASLALGEARPEPSEPPLSYNRKVLGDPVDPTLRALTVWAAGAPPLFTVANFGAHPTSIPAKLRRASADFPGILCRALDAEGSTGLFLNGSCGDVAPGVHNDASRAWWERRLEWMGTRLTQLARSARRPAEVSGSQATVLADTVLGYVEGELLLPPRRPWNVPVIGSAIAENYPDRVQARALRIGDLLLLCVPGEIGSDLGAQIRADALALCAASPAAPREVWLVTLADDYFGYVFSREQYLRGGMSQHLTVYGPGMGEHLRARLKEIAAAACGPSPPR